MIDVAYVYFVVNFLYFFVHQQDDNKDEIEVEGIREECQFQKFLN